MNHSNIDNLFNSSQTTQGTLFDKSNLNEQDLNINITDNVEIKIKEQKDEIKKSVKTKDRCHECNKRLGLVPFECKCGGSYCGKHRYDSTHNCTYDWKSYSKEKLIRSNPKIEVEKIKKI